MKRRRIEIDAGDDRIGKSRVRKTPGAKPLDNGIHNAMAQYKFSFIYSVFPELFFFHLSGYYDL